MSAVPNPESSLSAAALAKPLRSDGQEARTRLLDAALVLFADKGFAKTSTREIAQAAQVNVASISYYFGDKAVYTTPYSPTRAATRASKPAILMTLARTWPTRCVCCFQDLPSRSSRACRCRTA